MQKKVVKLFLLVATLFQSEFSDAQVYCGYPEVYKQTKITLDSGWGKSFVPTDIIQNFNGVWAVGHYDSNVLVARFNDTGMLEWVKQIGTDANDAQFSVRITSTDDGGAIVTGLSKIDDTRHLPWVANLNFNGDLRWIRRLEDIPGAPRNAVFTRAHVDDTGQILITGFVQESIRDYPVLVKLNRFGKVDFLKRYKDYLPSSTFTSYVSEYSDITNYLNQYVAVGTYTTADRNNPALYSQPQPYVAFIDSIGEVRKQIHFQTEHDSIRYEVNQVLSSNGDSFNVYLTGSRTDLRMGQSPQIWLACVNPQTGLLRWQKRFDERAGMGMWSYFDRDKLVLLHRTKHTDGSWWEGIAQLDTAGNVEFVHHVNNGGVRFQSTIGRLNLNANINTVATMRDGGLAIIGLDNAEDTAHLQLIMTKPCDENFCTNQVNSIDSSWDTQLQIRLAKLAESSAERLEIPSNNNSSYTFKQSISCRYCPMPNSNVTDVIVCDEPFTHIADVWDIYSKVTWSDGDNAKYKSISNTGKYWVKKENACGISLDTFTIYREYRPLKVLNDNEYYCRGRLFTLKGTQQQPGNFTYQWSTGDNGPELNVYSTQTVSLRTISNGCGERTDVVNVYEVNCDCEICVPNAFSPLNADGVNDEWMPRTDCKYTSCLVKEGTYSIYNRWGEKLAENPIDVAWNGRLADGSYVPEGAYVYKIKVVFDESVTGNRIIHQSGTVLVLAGDSK